MDSSEREIFLGFALIKRKPLFAAFFGGERLSGKQNHPQPHRQYHQRNRQHRERNQEKQIGNQRKHRERRVPFPRTGNGSAEQFTGFGLYDKSFVQTLRDLKDPTPFIRGIVAELGPERKEIEYTQPQRRAGKTHNNWYSLYDAAMLSFTSYTKVGMRLATFAGFVISALSFLVALGFLIAKLVAWNSFSAGYAPIIIAVFFMGGIQLAFLGFMGEYIMAMNTRIMNRPLVIEERRLNFNQETEVFPEEVPGSAKEPATV